jgi:hypothetical protein
MGNSGSQLRRKTVLLLLAVVGLSYGGYRLWDAWNFTSHAREAQGQVVDRNSSTFTIQYQVNGQTFQFDERLPSTKGMNIERRMELQPGASVAVLYDPASPANGRWKSRRLWFFPASVLFISALCGIAALLPDPALLRR